MDANKNLKERKETIVYYYIDQLKGKQGSINAHKMSCLAQGRAVVSCYISEFDGHLHNAEWLG